MLCSLHRMLIIFVCFFSFATAHAQETRVVVVPLGGDDIGQCEAITACEGGQQTVSCPSGDEQMSCSSPKLVFLTSSTHTGDLGGLEGADEICQDLANDAGRFGEFKAWLSAGQASPSDRMTQDTSHYLSTDGTVISNGLMQPGDNLLSEVNRDEYGNSLSSSDVWTGYWSLFPMGSVSCNDWTSGSTAEDGDIHDVGEFNINGLGAGISALCVSTHRIMCIEQSDPGN